MGSLSRESFEDFLDSLKQAGVAITGEDELRERLATAQSWRYAFMTMAANGSAIGIRFESCGSGCDEAEVRRTLDAYHLPTGSQTILSALKMQH
ncbi:MAG: hypothetical protein JSR19_12865 [Proteobacteria bacterium]|nr:hypothetical protein [Pseudomonadota bacterium]HQR03126.1 hypothetical protein [Rhodocyclaceae bacterium]